VQKSRLPKSAGVELVKVIHSQNSTGIVILKYLALVSQIIISKGKCISLFLSAEGLMVTQPRPSQVMIKHNFLL
jgi:hypothetical protein